MSPLPSVHECACTTIADVAIGLSPTELSHETAFRIFPIADQYSLQTILMWCSKAVGKTKLELWSPQPASSSDMAKHPGWVQWLASADEKHNDTLVESCLSHLPVSGDSKSIIPTITTIRQALASPHLRPLMDGLRPETMIKALSHMVGLPPDFKVGLMCMLFEVHVVCDL